MNASPTPGIDLYLSMLSVICPIYNEEKYIADCIESILCQDYPKDNLEVIFADGMSTDNTRQIVAQYTAIYPWIRLIDNPERIVSYGLNRAIDACKGDIVMRLDAHCKYPDNYFSRLTSALNELNADNVGGVCITLPAANTTAAKAIAEVLSSRFGMGSSDFRIGTDVIKQVDTVPFGCWPRKLFDKIGKFDTELIRNQDDEFNGRITKAKGKIYLLPDVRIEYFARDKISKVAKMFYQYGLFKPLVNKKLGSPATIRQFFPLALVCGLIVGAVLSPLSKWIMWAYIICVGFYLLLAVIFSVKSSHNLKQILYQIATYLTVHVSYGWGYLMGLCKLLFNRKFSAKANR